MLRPGLSITTPIREGVFERVARLSGMPEHSQQNGGDADSRLLDASAVAELLHVPTSWVYAETRAGRLPHVRIGRYRRFRPAAIQAWVEEHEQGPVR